ncbi:MAG: hypothetical protein H6828_07530 [Planctomycetes bacterium]|nr:hypothetical protein [Planctomycetota bacterium]
MRRTVVLLLALGACRAPRGEEALAPAPPREPAPVEVAVVAEPPAPAEVVGPPAPSDEELSRRERYLVARREARRAREQRRAELQLEVQRSPGWGAYESEHYLILSYVHDAARLDELRARAEATRARLVREFPAATPLGGANEPSGTVLRVFGSTAQYYEYGGPGGSSAYYSPRTREAVVLLDAHVDEPRPYEPLQHILVHEYFAERLGLADLPLWLLYGVAELYGGMDPRAGRLELPDAEPRLAEPVLQRAVDQVPLATLLGYGSRQFFGDNAEGLGAYGSARLAWSLVLFLDRGETTGPFWDPAWRGLVGRCVEAAATAEGEAPREAVQRVLDGVDLPALEAAWQAWVRSHAGSGASGR